MGNNKILQFPEIAVLQDGISGRIFYIFAHAEKRPAVDSEES